MYSALIVAGGESTRANLGVNKNLYLIKNKPIIMYSIDIFLADQDCETIVVVYPKKERDSFVKILPQEILLVAGGKTRQESVRNGLKLIKSKYVFIHDGARPNFSLLLPKLKSEMMKKNPLVPIIKVTDTIALVNNFVISNNIDRSLLHQVQTPQVFLTSEIIKAHDAALIGHHQFSDDQSLFIATRKKPVYTVEGLEENIKTTTKKDIITLEGLL